MEIVDSSGLILYAAVILLQPIRDHWEVNWVFKFLESSNGMVLLFLSHMVLPFLFYLALSKTFVLFKFLMDISGYWKIQKLLTIICIHSVIACSKIYLQISINYSQMNLWIILGRKLHLLSFLHVMPFCSFVLIIFQPLNNSLNWSFPRSWICNVNLWCQLCYSWIIWRNLVCF